MMNKQIRKLVLETDAYCDQHHPNHPHYDVLWEQKFAELIVRECARIARIEGDGGVVLEVACEQIKQHFGIE